jgi:hypothetical protein
MVFAILAVFLIGGVSGAVIEHDQQVIGKHVEDKK